MGDNTQVFHSSPTPYLVIWRRLVFVPGVLIVAATVAGQLRARRFPAYADLALSVCLPFVVYGALASLTRIGCSLFPVRLGADGIRSANLFGFPASARWDDIVAADVRSIHGIPYILIRARGRSQPIAVPVRLRDPSAFAEGVRTQANARNPLARLVRGAGTDIESKASAQTDA